LQPCRRWPQSTAANSAAVAPDTMICDNTEALR
jgi:hypothetical protein